MTAKSVDNSQSSASSLGYRLLQRINRDEADLTPRIFEMLMLDKILRRDFVYNSAR